MVVPRNFGHSEQAESQIVLRPKGKDSGDRLALKVLSRWTTRWIQFSMLQIDATQNAAQKKQWEAPSETCTNMNQKGSLQQFCFAGYV